MFKKFLSKAASASAALVLVAGVFAGCSDSFTTADGAVDADFARAAFSSSGDRIYATATSTPSDRLQFKLKCSSTIPSGTEFTFYTTYNNYSKFPSGTTLTVRDGAADPYTKWTTTLGTFGENTGNDITEGWYPVTVKTKTETKEIGFTFNGTFAKGSVIAIKNISIALSFAESDWKSFATDTTFKFTESKPEEFKTTPGASNPVNPPVSGNYPVMNKSGVKTFTLSKDKAGVKVDELSGLTLSKDKKYLIGNIDGGYLYKITFDGKTSKFGLTSGYKDSDGDGRDMEGLAMNPDTGDIYVCGEPNYFFKLTYSSDYKEYSTSSSFLKKISDASGYGNAGIEGIAWHKGNLYLGSQTGAYIWEYTPDGKQVGSVKELRKVTGDLISEVADLEYDPEHDWLWVLDSNDNTKKNKEKGTHFASFTIFLFNGDATKLLNTYYIGDFANNNPEALCVDKANKCIWIGEDASTAKLHKIPFDNL